MMCEMDVSRNPVIILLLKLCILVFASTVQGSIVAPSSMDIPQNAPAIHPAVHQRSAPNHKAPLSEPITPVASPSREMVQVPPEARPTKPRITPSISPVQSAPPTSRLPENLPAISPVGTGESPAAIPDTDVSPASTPPTSVEWKRNGMPVAAPPNETPHSPAKAIPPKGKSRHHSSPHFPPAVPPTGGQRHNVSPPFPKVVPPTGRPRHYAPPPFPRVVPPTGRPRHYAPPPFPTVVPPTGRPRHYAPPPLSPGSSVTLPPVPFPPSERHTSPASSPAPEPISDSTTMPFDIHPPGLSPSVSSSKSPKKPPPPPIRALPPPPPSEDCSGTICTEPLTNSPPGSPCACIWPIQVGLRLSVDLYTFFPLVAELAAETAAGVFMKQSQVRIVGANADTQQPEKTIVLIDLVPMEERFDNTTTFLTFQRFWHKKVNIRKSYFGDYDVLYVRYQGLPPSPPLAPSSIGIMDNGPYYGNGNNGTAIKPLGVDLRNKQHKNKLSGSIIAIIVLSAFVVAVLCSAAAWVLVLKHRGHASQQPPTPQASLPSFAKPSGTAGSMIGSVPSSASLSSGSSIATYTGSAKTYSITDIERATNNFDESRVLGEGGFGRVYSAVLDDGTKAAVKVLKRDDQQGGREFLAEVEMLSRLHHRNLVKLIGICTDERARCLVYKLIPNGSVESHLHGDDKESGPLDWVSRMKIALGAARGLAYLHEDSSPRVIHRDFKSSNVLLEHDFTPKVSDFGLARSALDEESRHISTRVMGTFGYVAPEYAMTGHLLVKSDVYSYGVVLLELLTGRKPVDMSQPAGQENLVAWARPLLTSTQGLEMMVDSSLGPDVPSDSVSKVAAIASMCVQPEVSHRPFMGEVVQALKLVCNECECEEAKEIGSQDNMDMDDGRMSSGSGQLGDPLHTQQFSTPNYGDPERELPSSGPLRTGRGWQRRMRSSGGSVSEHGFVFRSRPGSYRI